MNLATARSPRAGLAPLEFVLCLPMLLLIMAMIIIVGTAGAWKIRTSVNSRQAIFRAIDSRTGANDRKPDNWWPQEAAMSLRPSSPVFGSDPFVDYPVVRGPAIGASGGPALAVRNLLDMQSSEFSGFAEIDRALPLWRRLPYRSHYIRQTPVVSGSAWQHDHFGVGNEESRILILYDFP